MDTESQNIEFKQLWRDEYLKWICGFANAQGGTFGVSESDLMRSANLSTTLFVTRIIWAWRFR